MSTSSSVLVRTSAPPRPAPRRVSSRLLRSELAMVLRRPRNLAMLGVLAAVPVLIGVAVKLSSPKPGEGPVFIGAITGNGLFLSIASLVVVLPLFMPLAVAVVAGDAIAGEANLGSLRYLLVVPVSRTRLLAVKYVATVLYGLVAALTVVVVGAVVGLALFPRGPVTLLSGSTVPLSTAMLRVLLLALYVTAMLAGVAAIGIFLSTLTEVPVGAMAATVVLTIIAEILISIPQLAAIAPYLFPFRWLAFGDLLRSPVSWHEMGLGLATSAAYIGVFLALAWARFTTKDVSS